MKKIILDIKYLAELKETGMSDKQIMEYLREQGIYICEATIAGYLREYYKSIGKEKPRKRKYSTPINIQELVKLKEQGMSDKQITEHLNKQGINRCESTIAEHLRRYYKSIGKEKPRKQKYSTSLNIEKLAELKETGMSDKQIMEYLREQGIKKTQFTIARNLREYYKSIQKNKPKKQRYPDLITIEELVVLKETEMSDNEIAKHLSKQGIKITEAIVARKLRKYYKSKGKKKPIAKAPKKIIEIDIAELAELQKLKMSYPEIYKYLRSKGITTPEATIMKLLKQLDADAPDKKETIQSQEQEFEKNETSELDNNDIEALLMSGMTIEEFILKYGKNEKELLEKLEKLRVIAEYSKKENNQIIPDQNFIRVLELLKGPKLIITKYELSLENYIKFDSIEQGKIDEIKDMVFSGNSELMVYIFTRLNVKMHSGYDKRLFKYFKKEFQYKIHTYLERIKKIDDSRRVKHQNDLDRDEK